MKKKSVKKSKVNKLEEEFISWGNRKKVFWPITIIVIILSLIGIPIMLQDKTFFERFLVIWILEIIYISMFVRWGEKKKKLKRI
jgi:hypothetical protein